MDLGIDLPLGPLEFGAVYEAGKLLARRQDGIALFPPFDLVDRPIAHSLVGSGTDMTAEPIGLDLNEVRALAGADLRNDPVERAQEQLGVVSVKLLDRQSEYLRALRQLGHGLTPFDRGMGRVFVVFANDQERQMMQGREIERLIGDAFVENPVADARDADIVHAAVLL